MWIPRWYWENLLEQNSDLERRVKRLELMVLEDANHKIASLQNKSATSMHLNDILPIEEIVWQSIGEKTVTRTRK